MNKRKTPTKSQRVKWALLDTIDGDGYDTSPDPLTTELAKRKFLKETFEAEYGWYIERVGRVAAAREWCQGLPSAVSFPFYNHTILDVMESLGMAYKHNDNRTIDRYWSMIGSTVALLATDGNTCQYDRRGEFDYTPGLFDKQ